MTEDHSQLLSHRNAIGRWAAVGPYYAMFPVSFAFDVIQKYSRKGDAILDPFAGRSSSLYAAAAQGRSASGVEINEVGYLYGKVKLDPAPRDCVEKRIDEIAKYTRYIHASELEKLPEFFTHCYSPEVLRYLLAARKKLLWKTDSTDATLMALILIDLHGKEGSAFSNQMRQGKAMSPQYAVQWWQERNMTPPQLDPAEFLKKKIAWRYDKGLPNLKKSKVHYGNSLEVLPRMKTENPKQKYDLLFTSPPYYAVTDYHYDQWLRLWMLGKEAKPVHGGGDSRGRFQSREYYVTLLEGVFGACVPLLKRNATIYIRTDARDFTFDTTEKVLKTLFPKKKLEVVEQPFSKDTQTALYGDKQKKPGERDIILLP